MPPSTESSVVIRFIRGAQQAPILDAEHGIETQVVANPLVRRRRSVKGYLSAAVLLVGGAAAAWIVATRTTATAEPRVAAAPAVVGELAPAVAEAPDPAPVPLVISMADDDAATDEAVAPEETEVTGPVLPAQDPELAPGPAPSPKKRRIAATRVQSEPTTGARGVLMIASKPPCRIFVDGQDTGLTTPQRAIKLKPGRHTINLVNHEFDLDHDVSVDIQPGAKVRIVRDLTGTFE